MSMQQYPHFLMTGQYVGFFRYNMTIEPYTSNSTFTFNSCFMAAGWLYPIDVRIVELNWADLDKITFFPNGSRILDTGFENLCITFY